VPIIDSQVGRTESHPFPDMRDVRTFEFKAYGSELLEILNHREGEGDICKLREAVAESGARLHDGDARYALFFSGGRWRMSQRMRTRRSW
jgi:hypothetical protein